MVAPLAASDSIWEQGYQSLFGILPLASDALRGTVRMADSLGVQRIASITTDDLFPALSAEGVVDEAAQLDLDVVVEEIYPPGTLDVGPLITQLEQADPEFVFAPVDVADAIILVQQMQERGYRPAGLSLAGATFVPDFVDNVGGAANGLYGFVYWHRTLPTSDDIFGTAEEFATEFEATAGYEPTHDTAAALAAVSALKLAVEAAGSLDQTAVRDAMRALDAKTVFGPIKFDATGYNLALKYPYVVQWHDDDLVVTYPEDSAGAAPIYPIEEWGTLP
jgi:branched-chain amino acid transport system substrate-binding protein